jgi:signal peptidase II
MRYRIIISLAVFLAALDQAAKWLVTESLAPGEFVRLTSFFNLVNVRNYGAAFGLLNDPSNPWRFWLFFAATVLAFAVVAYVAKSATEKDRPLFFALGCICGGALGNCLDRIRIRSVVDFLDFHIRGYHWPAFNVADICICLGAFSVALIMLRSSAGERKPSIRP